MRLCSLPEYLGEIPADFTNILESGRVRYPVVAPLSSIEQDTLIFEVITSDTRNSVLEAGEVKRSRR
jgi:hypothetical protein